MILAYKCECIPAYKLARLCLDHRETGQSYLTDEGRRSSNSIKYKRNLPKRGDVGPYVAIGYEQAFGPCTPGEIEIERRP